MESNRSYLAWVTITKHHRLGAETTEMNFLTVLEVQDQDAIVAGFCKAWLADSRLLSLSSNRGERRDAVISQPVPHLHDLL